LCLPLLRKHPGWHGCATPKNNQERGISMQPQAANSNPLSDLSRCQHRFPSRRRCRLPVSDLRTGLCGNHVRDLQQRELADLSSALVGQMTKFETYDDINDVLSRLLVLTSLDRVSPRRAAVIAYICNLLLRS